MIYFLCPALSIIFYYMLLKYLDYRLKFGLYVYVISCISVAVAFIILTALDVESVSNTVIEETFKYFAALFFLKESRVKYVVIVGAFGFAELTIVKPLIVALSDENVRFVIYNRTFITISLYCSAAFMHLITVCIMSFGKNGASLLMLLAINVAIHILFNSTREMYDIFIYAGGAYSLIAFAELITMMSIAYFLTRMVRRRASEGILATP